MNWSDLENELYDVIRECCQTAKDVEDAKEHFDQWTVSEMIEDALEK